jgi:hypothetical protein
MRPLRYSVNVTLDGCCDHRAGMGDQDLHRHATQGIAQAMQAAWRGPAALAAMPEWTHRFGQPKRPATAT